MIRVRTASRLHFGLLSLPTDEVPSGARPPGDGVPCPRHFGGVGLMVREPGLRLVARPAPSWSADGPLAERALAFAGLFCQALEDGGVRPPPPRHLHLEQAAPEHAGLGTGTQLGLAVAAALAEAAGLGAGPADLARRVGRGARSALGVHGFAHGGFLVEAGKTDREALAPLVARLPFPADWRMLLVVPGQARGLHGPDESEAFRRLAGRRPEPARTDALCRLALLGMLPALGEHDLPAFGEALYEFNRLVGEAFRPVQGGTYAHPGGEEVVRFLRGRGVRGVGQSSWGPALFAVTADAPQAEDLARQLRQRFGFSPDEVLVAAAANEGAQVSRPGAGASPP
jgi:beta-RFAP synthase